jgi:photosystem II stability/assembly factor-like uncharacterized protein
MPIRTLPLSRSVFRVLVPCLIAAIVGASSAGPLRAEGTWQVLARATDQNLHKLSFVDDLTGWAVGDAGTILVTRDGGHHWDAQICPVDFDVIDIDMLDARVGWALAQYRGESSTDYKSTVLRTKNGGSTWEVQGSFDGLFHAIGFGTESRGVVCGEQGRILFTDNAGLDWAPANVEDPDQARWPIRNVDFHSPTFALAMGGKYDMTGLVWRTLDGGQNWTHTQVAGEPVFASFAFDAENIVCVGGDLDYGAGMVTTSRGGESWDYTDLGIWGQAEAVAFRDPFEGWSPLGFAGTLMYSKDSGHSWTSIATPDGTPMHDVEFTGDGIGYMVGDHGTVLGYVAAGTAVPETGLRTGDAPLLSQNTPNPFRPETQFAFRVPAKQAVTLRIFDTAGRQVATVVNETLLPGNYTRTFDASELTAGVYYYRLTVGKDVETRKMVLLR